MQCGGLSGSVWPQKPDDLTLVDFETDVFDGRDAPVAFGEASCGDGGHGTGSLERKEGILLPILTKYHPLAKP
jgi:hypothetical protein